MYEVFVIRICWSITVEILQGIRDIIFHLKLSDVNSPSSTISQVLKHKEKMSELSFKTPLRGFLCKMARGSNMLNPLSPGGLDPGYTRGVITDHEEKKIKKILKTHLFTLRCFFVRRAKNEIFWKCFFFTSNPYISVKS